MTIEIIAEIAQGYEGKPAQALLLARAAVRSGADSVKFQLIYADELATPDYKYYDLFRSLEMPREAWKAVADEIKHGGGRIYLDVYGEKSLGDAIDLGAAGVKIHTTEFFNTRLVRHALDVMPRIFISLGGISVNELEEFIDNYNISPADQVCFMYGYQAEPTPLEANNLNRLVALKKRFPGYKFGFMDHADGSSDDAMNLALMALPFGIECIEKHLSLDRILQLEDYVSALSPEKFQIFTRRIRHYEIALGTEDLSLTTQEKEYRNKAMKVVVASRHIKKGTMATPDALSLKRVAVTSQSSFNRIDLVAGCTLLVDVKPDEQITEEMIK